MQMNWMRSHQWIDNYPVFCSSNLGFLRNSRIPTLPISSIATVFGAAPCSIKVSVLLFVGDGKFGKSPASVGFNSEGKDLGENPLSLDTVNWIIWPTVCFSSLVKDGSEFSRITFWPAATLEKSTSRSTRSPGEIVREESVTGALRYPPSVPI